MHTWPNAVTREFCESQLDGHKVFMPKTFVTSVFVDMLAGPLDMNNGLADLTQAGRVDQGVPVPSTLTAEIGEYIVMARQAADGAWLVGAATNATPREWKCHCPSCPRENTRRSSSRTAQNPTTTPTPRTTWLRRAKSRTPIRYASSWLPAAGRACW